jgi:hypothetical protein
MASFARLGRRNRLPHHGTGETACPATVARAVRGQQMLKLQQASFARRDGELKFAAARSSVTPLPLNKLAASFVNRFRAVTQPKACAAGRASLACAGRSASAAGKECLRHEATTVPQPPGPSRWPR